MGLRREGGIPLDYEIGTALYLPMLGRAGELWAGVLSELESNPAYPRRIWKARAIRRAFPDEANALGIPTNAALAVIAEYLSAMGQGQVDAKRVSDASSRARRLLAEVEGLRSEVSKMAAALTYSETHETGTDAHGAFYLAASLAGEAEAALRSMTEQLGQAADTPRTRAGLDRVLRRTPEETFARHLGQFWVAAGLSTDGGEKGGGVDDVLAFVIEATDPQRSPGGSRKSWLYERLMPLAVEAGGMLAHPFR